jgi:hypothetical protein
MANADEDKSSDRPEDGFYTPEGHRCEPQHEFGPKLTSTTWMGNQKKRGASRISARRLSQRAEASRFKEQDDVVVKLQQHHFESTSLLYHVARK